MTLAAAPVAVLGSHQLLIFLLQVGLLLLLALLIGKLTERLGLTAIVGELLVGVLLGPSVLAHLAPRLDAWLVPHATAQFHLLDAVGQLGVLLLVGVTGTQMDLGLVRRKGRTAAAVGVLALIVPLTLGAGIGLGLPGGLVPAHDDRAVLALFLGVAFGVSAIPVIARILADMRMLHRDIGQLVVCAATVDDIAGWLLLSVCTYAATGGVHPGSIAGLLVRLVLFLVAAVVLRPVVGIALKRVCVPLASGPAVTLTASAILLASAATAALQLEAVIGAFACGIVIRSCGTLDPAVLKPLNATVMSVFAPLYFAMAGLRMDLTALAHPAVLLAALAMLVAAVAGKAAGGYAGARMSRLTRWEAIALSAGVNSRGIVEVIVATTGLRLGVLDQRMYTVVMLIAIATSAMAPPVLRWAMAHVEYTAQERLRAGLFAVETPPAETPPAEMLPAAEVARNTAHAGDLAA